MFGRNDWNVVIVKEGAGPVERSFRGKERRDGEAGVTQSGFLGFGLRNGSRQELKSALEFVFSRCKHVELRHRRRTRPRCMRCDVQPPDAAKLAGRSAQPSASDLQRGGQHLRRREHSSVPNSFGERPISWPRPDLRWSLGVETVSPA